MATVEMSFTPLPAHVRTARLVATAVARRSGVQEALLDEVRLAVGEACSRAVEAHRAHCPAEPVRIELTGADGRFEVVVTDAAARDDQCHGDAQGAGSANGLPAPGNGAADDGLPGEGLPGADGHPDDPESLLPQGLGLAVIAGLADDVKISRTAAGLSIRMSWPSGEYAR
jgi:serine/threonine-protein kinase RsbW